jgi:hypothetical protein
MSFQDAPDVARAKLDAPNSATKPNLDTTKMSDWQPVLHILNAMRNVSDWPCRFKRSMQHHLV